MHIGNQKMTVSGDCSKLSESGSTSHESGYISGILSTQSDIGASQTDLTASACDVGPSDQGACSSRSYLRNDSGLDVSESFSHLNLSTEEKALIPSTSVLRDSDYPQWERYFLPNEDGDTPLHLAIMQSNFEVATSLISIAPHSSALDFQNEDHQTPLHLAVMFKQHRLARHLVAAGVRINVRDLEGNCPLHIAARQGDLDCVQAVSMAMSATEVQQFQIRYPPCPQLHELSAVIDATNYNGLTPLHLASIGGYIHIIRAFNWLGANFHLQEIKAGRTAVHLAAERGHLEAVLVLLNECGCSIEAETYAGYTPYQIAYETNSEIADELVKLGAIPLPIQMDDSDSDSDVS